MAVPMIDDLQLTAAQHIRQEIDQGFAEHRVAGLDGTVHQRLARRSHRVVLTGVMVPETATADLQALQGKAAAGEEVTFTADITTALEIEHMVIRSFVAEQHAGGAGQFAYTIDLAESPPLPPPAELSAFGGLGEFGLGDLGFDAGALGDVLGAIADQAGALGEVLDAALDAVDTISSLAAMADLDIGDLTNPLRPISERIDELSELGSAATSAIAALRGLLPGGGG